MIRGLGHGERDSALTLCYFMLLSRSVDVADLGRHSGRLCVRSGSTWSQLHGGVVVPTMVLTERATSSTPTLQIK